MKKLLQHTFFCLLLLSIVPVQLKAESEKGTKKTMNAVESAQAKVLTTRLEEINAMDKSSMTRIEKKALRKEVKSINTNLAELNGGVYLTTGAIIIIILLLILIL
ncbi:MAG: hypothetical protein V4683_08005 [Bacteroidota bacterium]